MIALWPWVSRAAAALGLGVLPLSWAPVRPVFGPVRLVIFAWGLLPLLISVWPDLQLLTSGGHALQLYCIGRVLLMFLAVWWSHSGLFHVASRLEVLCIRFPKYDRPRSTREICACLFFLAVLNFASTEELYMESSFIKPNESYSVRYVMFTLMGKNLDLLVPTLYIMFVDEFTYLFQKVDYLWKKELDSLISGCVDSELQDFRVFHTEISSLVSDFTGALGVNMLLYFAFTFSDVVLAFYQYSNSPDETYYVLAFRVLVSTAAILLIVRCTQSMVEVSEDISSNIRCLQLSKLSTLDKIQVELLLQKLKFRPVKVDVCGMFTINKQLILEIIMGVTTCCNAVVQLKPYVIIQTYSQTTQNSTGTPDSNTTKTSP